MTRDEIVARLEAVFAAGVDGNIFLAAIERAGLTIIPLVADETEIKRIENAILVSNPGHAEVASALERKARAAAAAVRSER